MPRPQQHLLIAAGLGALLCAACSSDEVEATAAKRAAVVYGVESGPEDDAVVRVLARLKQGYSECTGSMVAPTLLLTALHCISYFNQGSFSCGSNGELLDSVSNAGTFDGVVPASDIVVKVGATPASAFDAGVAARGLKVYSLGTPSICRNDIALVKLDQDLGLRLPIRLRSGVATAETMRVVGYGTNEDGGSGVRRSRSDVPVRAAGPSDYCSDSTCVARPGTFTVGQGPCQGDSGGPALTDRNAVAGVFSLSGEACTSASVITYCSQVAAFEKDLIIHAFEDAGELPLLEGETEPGAGVGGSNTGGSGAGGEGGTAGDTGGTDTGGDATGGSVELRGPRKKGGCKCEAVGATPSWWQLLGLLPLGGMVARRRSRRFGLGATGR